MKDTSLPYKSAEFVKGSLKQGVATLVKGNVKAAFKSSSQSSSSSVTMMVVPLPDDYKHEGKVSLSPLVALGPLLHTNIIPDLVVELILPLKTSPGEKVSVWISHTPCDEKPEWHLLLNNSFVVENDRVVVSSKGFCRYQAHSHPPNVVLNVTTESLYFSAHAKCVQDKPTLVLRSSFERAHFDFKPSLSQSISLDTEQEAIALPIIPGNTFNLALTASEGSIMKATKQNPTTLLATPQPLNESITLDPRQLLSSRLRSEGQKWEWIIKPPRRGLQFGRGEFIARSSAMTAVEGIQTGKNQQFAITWPEVCSYM